MFEKDPIFRPQASELVESIEVKTMNFSHFDRFSKKFKFQYQYLYLSLEIDRK